MFHVERNLLALGLVALAGCAGHGQVGREPASRDLDSEERVTFESGGVTLEGFLLRPAGPGPFPAVVLLHGCAGLRDARGRVVASYGHWARHLRDAGYVALLVDSFGPRGVREICTQEVRQVLPGRDRARDAFAARHWLAGREEVRPDRIHLLGWSNGGTAVLHALRGGAPGREPGPHGFRSGVALYPGCAALRARAWAPVAPVLIQAGAADDWTPAAECVALARQASGTGAPVSIDVHPGAHHAFDRVGPEATRFRPDVRNPSSPTGRGATVGPHPEAREKAWRRILDFLAANP